jgi:hypothetical protein
MAETPAIIQSRFTGGAGAWAILVVVGALAWGAVLIGKPITVPSGTAAGYLSSSVDLRLDPNVATVGELAAIVGLGEKHAADIVNYRTQFEAAHSGIAPFGALADLEAAKGIGPKTAQIAAPYLVFPNPAGGVAGGVVKKRASKS